MDTSETNNGITNEQSNETPQTLQQNLEHNRLKQLALNEAMHKTKDALNKVQGEIEDLKKSGGQL